MEDLKLKDLNLSLEESRDIIEFLARKRGISNYKRKSNNESLHAFKEYKTKNNQQQKIKSKNKERIDVIREELKELSYKLSKSELKKIKKNLYQIELYYHDDDFEYRGIKNVKDLFKLSIDKDYYKPTLVKSGYNNNYIRYESKGDKILTVKEYLSLIEPYLAYLINDYKSKGEWKIQLTAEINFVSLKPDSNETCIMHTKSDNEEIMVGSDTSDVIKELFKSFLQRYQESLQEKMKGSDLNLMVLIYCIMIIIT